MQKAKKDSRKRILNPKTGRKVLATGTVGKKIKKLIKSTAKQPKKPTKAKKIHYESKKANKSQKIHYKSKKANKSQKIHYKSKKTCKKKTKTARKNEKNEKNDKNEKKQAEKCKNPKVWQTLSIGLKVVRS